jgi:hypothetical protein
MPYNREYSRKYRKEHCKELKEYRRKYEKEHPEVSTRWKDKNPSHIWALATIHTHKRKGFDIKVSVSEIEALLNSTKNCPYCRVELKRNRGKLSFNSPSLDRINMEKEMRVDNIEVICHQCNTTKGNRTKQEFITYMKSVLRNQKEVPK